MSGGWDRNSVWLRLVLRSEATSQSSRGQERAPVCKRW